MMMTKRVQAIFDDPAEARRAVRALLEAGLARDQVSIMSSEPHLEEGEPLTAPRRTQIGWWVLAGGIAGAGLGFALVYFTAHAYPIVTGGMPLVPPLTTGIIMYETAAMGAIFFGLARMLWEARLPQWRAPREDYAAELADGGILVSAPAGSEDGGPWRRLLIDAGGRALE
jgi:hypothetical protein